MGGRLPATVKETNMTRTEAIAIALRLRETRFENADGTTTGEPSHANERVFAAGSDSALQALLCELAKFGAFDDGRNMVDQLVGTPLALEL